MPHPRPLPTPNQSADRTLPLRSSLVHSGRQLFCLPSSTSCLQAPVVSSVTLLLLPVQWGRGSSLGLQSAVYLQVPSVFPSSGPGF